VRFGQEIGGMMELASAGRGENAEIVSFVGRAVESELSGKHESTFVRWAH